MTTSTFYIGEIANLIGSIFYILPASIIYEKSKTKKKAIVSMSIGIIVSSIACTIMNGIVLFPLYMKIYNITYEYIINQCSKIFPFINSSLKVMLFSVLPFNIFKFSIVSIVVCFIYKSISNFIKGTFI